MTKRHAMKAAAETSYWNGCHIRLLESGDPAQPYWIVTDYVYDNNPYNAEGLREKKVVAEFKYGKRVL